jgi:6-phosphogluconolactonase
MSQKLEILSFRSAEEIAQAAAERWINALQERKTQSRFGIALSGGRIAKTLYTQMVLNARGASIDWNSIHFFWADERCVPPGDSNSNYAAARDFLLKPLGIEARNVHRVLGEIDPEQAAEKAETELCGIVPKNKSGRPVLDLIFLGMGEDGHVASLFPDELPEVRENPKVYRNVIAPKPPPQRVTLGYQPLFAARQVWILASGPGKLEAFQGLLQADLRLPVVQVIERRTHTVLFEDICQAHSEKMSPNPRHSRSKHQRF